MVSRTSWLSFGHKRRCIVTIAILGVGLTFLYGYPSQSSGATDRIVETLQTKFFSRGSENYLARDEKQQKGLYEYPSQSHTSLGETNGNVESLKTKSFNSGFANNLGRNKKLQKGLYRNSSHSHTSFPESNRAVETLQTKSVNGGVANDLARSDIQKKRFPQCIIIGAMKSGTSALRRLLSLHPRIRVALKEAHFFDSKDLEKKSLETYREQMPLSYANDITVEKTPSYFISELARKRISQFNRAMKILVVFKHPVTRAIADYRHYKDRHQMLRETFQQYVTKPSGALDLTCRPLNTSLYVEHMKRWYMYFPKDQVHVVDGEKLITNPVDEIRLVEDFLGLEHAISNDAVHFDEKKGFFCFRGSDKETYRCLHEGKGERPKPYVNPKFEQRLKVFYRPYNEELYKLVNRTFYWD